MNLLSDANKIFTIEYFDNEKAWLNARSIGGTNASAILGENPFTNALEVYNDIVNSMDFPHKKKKKNEENEAMARGKAFEPIIRKAFMLDFENKFEVSEPPKNNWLFRSKAKPYLTASTDGVLFDKDTKQNGILEIKTRDIRNGSDAAQWNSGELPQHYYIQMLHYLLVTGYDYAIMYARLRYFDYFNESGIKLVKAECRPYVIYRKDVEKELVFLEKKLTEFWEENVLKRIPPKVKITF